MFFKLAVPEEVILEARKSAMSIGAKNDPDEPVFIGEEHCVIKRKKVVFKYYRDKNNEYFYTSSRTDAFEKEIQSHKNRKRKSLNGI